MSYMSENMRHRFEFCIKSSENDLSAVRTEPKRWRKTVKKKKERKKRKLIRKQIKEKGKHKQEDRDTENLLS